MKFVILDSGKEALEFPLQLGNTLIGSAERLEIDLVYLDNQEPDYYLIIPRESVAVNHALITFSGFDVWILDLQSGLETFVDNRRLDSGERVQLSPGARVRIGNQTQLVLEDSRAKEKNRRKLQPTQLGDFGPIRLLPALKNARPYKGIAPPGCSLQSLFYLRHLPEIYQSNVHEGSNAMHISFSGPSTNFLSRLLAIFESVYLPLDWMVDAADLLLDPKTTTSAYMNWMLTWFGIPFANTWPLEKRAALLQNMDKLYARRGTKWALSETIGIYTETMPSIEEEASDLTPYEFSITVNVSNLGVTREEVQSHMLTTMTVNPEATRDEAIRKVEPIYDTVAQIVEHFKPAHTMCKRITLYSH